MATDLIKFKNLVKQKVPGKDIAKRLGITPGRVSQLKKELGIAVTRVVAADKAPVIVKQEIDAAGQLQKANEHANWLLEHLMKWIKGDAEAIQVLEQNARLVNKGTKEEPEWVTEYKIGDPYQTALKAMAEIRNQLKLQLEIFTALYDMQAVADFQAEIVDLLGEVDLSVKREFVKRLKEKRAVYAAFDTTGGGDA